MKKLLVLMILAMVVLSACDEEKEIKNESMSIISSATIDSTVEDILASPDAKYIDMVERGVNSAARYWTAADGTEEEFRAFCVENYVGDSAMRHKLFMRLDHNIESFRGHNDMVYVDYMYPQHVVGDTLLNIDNMFAAYDPTSHFVDDMFETKIAFVALLNFPIYTLEEKNELGKSWSREQWAYARMADWFTARVPASLNAAFVKSNSEADSYITSYDIKMGCLRSEKGEKLFPDGMSLIAHWNLRDELKAEYSDTTAVAREKQEIIYQVMLRIIDQSIPAKVINSEEYLWKPYSNEVTDLSGKKVGNEREEDVRYKHLLAEFKACRALDRYCPAHPTAIARAFDRDMEVSDSEIEKIFTNYLSSPEAGRVVALVRERLGRELRPYDIWYDGFKTRSQYNIEELNSRCRAKYPNPEAFKADMANILMKLGFEREKALFIESQVEVEASRSAGHAWTSQAKFEHSRLRTRIQPEGFDYLGYNIACHEFGHNVEQTISIQDVDYYSMARVPSTAFTEALAFVFQKRDMELLGIESKNPEIEALNMIDIFWNGYEMMGVSLVDLYTWRWMYEHQECTASELREEVIEIAKEVWNRYYAPHFGVKDSPILAIYSHMIAYPLYLSNYAYGNLVEAELEEYFRGKVVGGEICRIYKGGRLTPNLWMQNAVGEDVTEGALLRQTAEALSQIGK